MISSVSAFRMVFALPTSKSFVKAIDFTTVKYCCRKPRNFRLPMPPFSTLRKTSLTCSALKSKPSRDAMCAQNPSSEMQSSALPASSSKSFSNVIPLFSTSPRKAEETRPNLASTSDEHFSRTASTEFLEAETDAATLASILWRSFLASNSGPFVAFGIFACCSFVQALASLAASSSSFRSCSASSSRESGVAKASSSAPSAAVSGVTASATFFAQASTTSIFADASAIIAAASLRSRASMWAFFSACSFLTKSLLAARIFFLSASIPFRLAVTAALHFVNAARASAAALPAFVPSFWSSLSLVLTKTRACRTLFAPSSTALSMSAAKALYGM
mmetsp:Transcript_62160/g.185161  ORF Transcript_62160/g.185161 Transcript_62160/m.185161 type:complete len:333 (-) Transcript_62160:1845-2843(-)